MELSSADGLARDSARLKGRLAGGAPVYTYQRRPGLPPVSVARFQHGTIPRGSPPDHAHAHDFLVLVYFETGGGSLRIDDRDWLVRAGDAFVIAPGEVIGSGVTASLEAAQAWTVFFPPDVLEPRTAGEFLSWRAHPLLFPFVGGLAGGAQRLHVPPVDRAAWSQRLAALDRELAERRDGYNEAVLAHLTPAAGEPVPAGRRRRRRPEAEGRAAAGHRLRPHREPLPPAHLAPGRSRPRSACPPVT